MAAVFITYRMCVFSSEWLARETNMKRGVGVYEQMHFRKRTTWSVVVYEDP